METIKINGKVYYNTDDVIHHNKEYFKTCKGRIRNLIKMKSLEYDIDYLFCNKKTGEWQQIDNIGKPAVKDKMFIRKKWCDNIPNFTTKVESRELVQVLQVPDILVLCEEEQFCDGDYYYSIEIRGTRDVSNCYFSANDICDVFEIKNINGKMTDKKSKFIPNVDYVKFIAKGDNKYFLTYNGVLKIIYTSRCKLAQYFQEWTTSTLFTLHLGTVDDKADLLTSYIGTNAELCKKVFSSMVTPVSCIYFITLGTVKDLKGVFPLTNIDDNHIVCKYGRTNDFKRRIGELILQYKKKNKSICLEFMYCAFIDDMYASEAETDISDIFNIGINKIPDIDENELVIIDRKKLNSVKGHYKSIENNYGKQYENMKEKYNTDIHDLKNEHIKVVNELEMKIKDGELSSMKKERKLVNELNEKDKCILTMQLGYEKELNSNKVDILEMKNEMLKMQLAQVTK